MMADDYNILDSMITQLEKQPMGAVKIISKTTVQEAVYLLPILQEGAKKRFFDMNIDTATELAYWLRKIAILNEDVRKHWEGK